MGNSGRCVGVGAGGRERRDESELTVSIGPCQCHSYKTLMIVSRLGVQKNQKIAKKNINFILNPFINTHLVRAYFTHYFILYFFSNYK